MGTTVRCSKCGQNLVTGVFQIFDGKKLCSSCYAKAVEEAKQDEQALQDLFEYIKALFGITQIPFDWLEIIQTYLKDKKTYFGIRATLYYYYEILGNKADSDGPALRIVRYQYDAASQYFQEQRALREHNLATNMDATSRVITMVSPVNVTRKPPYNIEDL